MIAITLCALIAAISAAYLLGFYAGERHERRTRNAIDSTLARREW